MTDIKKMDLASKDLVAERIEQLKALFPEIVTESENAERERERDRASSHSINFDKLRLLLGDEVDEGQERYAFTWPGKTDAIRQSQTVSTATLRPCPEKSRGRDGEDGSFDSDNIYIEGDNLEVLKLLQRAYHGKVKMIYIDPPYNTGKDFVYHDNFGDTIGNYKHQAGLTGQSNADTNGRFHSDWCSMMYPRLKLARELLSEDGVIFISIDDKENRNLRILCDEIFGEGQFATNIIWKSKSGGANDSRAVAIDHEYILVYSRGQSECCIGLDPYAEATTSYNQEDDKGRYSLERLDKQNLSYSKALDYDITGPDGLTYKLQHKDPDNPNAIWRWSKERVAAHMDELVFKNGHVYTKNYEKKGGKLRSLFVDEKYGRTRTGSTEVRGLLGGDYFDNPKPSCLIRNLVAVGSESNSLVLDFFSGSGTTADAVMQLNAEDGGNRRFIVVQLPEVLLADSAAAKAGNRTICDIGEERIRQAGNKIKTEFNSSGCQPASRGTRDLLPDIGFRVFKLDGSGVCRPEPNQLWLDVIDPNRSELDIIFEMMLKWGLELTLPVEKSEAAGYPIWSVACDELICCMTEGLTIDALEAIADMDPRRVLILDSVLTDSLKLNALQIFKHAGERMGIEIDLRTV